LAAITAYCWLELSFFLLLFYLKLGAGMSGLLMMMMGCFVLLGLKTNKELAGGGM